MPDLDLLLGALDDTIASWEPDDGALRIVELLRRNLAERINAERLNAHEADPAEDPF